MYFERKKVGDVLVARVQSDRITGHEAPDMKTSLLGMIIGEEKKILINLRKVEQMDSTGMGALLFAIRQAERNGKDIRFCELNKKSKFLIHIAHLDEVIDIYDKEAEALKDFEGGDDEG
jgi:anti-sigma B factor antagonist